MNISNWKSLSIHSTNWNAPFVFWNSGQLGNVSSRLGMKKQNEMTNRYFKCPTLEKLTSPLKLSFKLVYKVVTLSQKVWNSGITKSFRKILTKSGKFPAKTWQNCSYSKFNDSKLAFGLCLNSRSFSMTNLSLGSLKGRMPVRRIS